MAGGRLLYGQGAHLGVLWQPRRVGWQHRGRLRMGGHICVIMAHNSCYYKVEVVNMAHDSCYYKVEVGTAL